MNLRPLHRLFRVLPLLLAFAAPIASAAEREISDAVAAQLPALRTLIDRKDYPAAIKHLDERILPKAEAGSFDLLVASQIKAQILLTKGDYAAAIAPLETVRTIDAEQNFLDEDSRRETAHYLAQLHFNAAASAKAPASQRVSYEAALARAREWLTLLKEQPTADALSLNATLLYTLATLDADTVDRDRLAEARALAERILLLSARPKDESYVLLLACQQQAGDLAGAAEILELLVERSPKSATYWGQLAAAYLNLAAARADDAAESARLNTRAILTLRRARANDCLNSPRDLLNLVGLYFNLGQFDRAAPMLENGLADGSLENTRSNWELLANCHEQLGHPDKALAVLEQAVARLPADGRIELSLAQTLYARNQVEPAYRHALAAVDKPGLDRPGAARLFLAYLAYELRRYDDALRHVEAAAALPDTKAEELDRLRTAIADANRSA